MKNKRKRFYFIPLFIAAFVLILGWIVMLLWNAILPDLLHVNTVTYPKALGLLVLCKILFGGFRPGPSRGFRKGGPPWRSKLMNLSAEEREKFRKEWLDRTADDQKT